MMTQQRPASSADHPSTHRPSLRSLLALPTISSLILPTIFLSLISPSHAYIPALPVNDTSGLNLTDSDSSTIAITWTAPPSAYGGGVSYQLQADVPTGGTTSGALVHFTESEMGPNASTSTPWIAYISCDYNETGASLEWDIFTLARDRGAVSALLYTATSESCLLNQEYITDFEKPLDVFATKTVQVARLIDNQWTHTNDSFYYFNSTLLTSSAMDVNNSLADNPPIYRTYLIGTLTARNSTGQAVGEGIPNAYPSQDTSVATKKTPGSMIALYVITGIISAAFVLMVVVGARRALRHPERYGRREATDDQGPQSTAGGIAQAILDTFPVIKFHRAGVNDHAERNSPKDVASEAGLGDIALPVIRRTDSRPVDSSRRDSTKSYHTAGSEPSQTAVGPRPRSDSIDDKMGDLPLSTLPSASRPESDSTGKTTELEDSQAEAGEDQCPICLHDFETGDDLRVLPCEIRHVYHKACIDPWLLQVSSSCPLCRKDFNNPTPPPTTDSQPPSPATTETNPPTQSGFTKYLAFMRRERRGTGGSGRRPRANTAATGSTLDSSIGRARRREADQTGPGGY